MDTQLTAMEAVLKAFADTTRLRIVGLLLTGEVCVGDIHTSLGISQPKASRHLAYLRRARLVEVRRDRTWIHYRLAFSDDSMLRTLEQIIAHAVTHLPPLRKDVERLQKLTGRRRTFEPHDAASWCCPLGSRT